MSTSTSAYATKNAENEIRKIWVIDKVKTINTVRAMKENALNCANATNKIKE